MESLVFANKSNCRRYVPAPGENCAVSACLQSPKSHQDEAGLPNKS